MVPGKNAREKARKRWEVGRRETDRLNEEQATKDERKKKRKESKAISHAGGQWVQGAGYICLQDSVATISQKDLVPEND